MTVEAVRERDLSARVVIEIDVALARKRVDGRRVSQAWLARRISRTPVWLSDRMTGRVRLTIDDLALIAEGLECSVVDLLPRDERSVTRGYPPAHSVKIPLPRSPLASTYPTGGRPPARPPMSGPSRGHKIRPTGR